MATVVNVNIHLGILYRLWLNISKAPDEPQQDLTSFILQDPKRTKGVSYIAYQKCRNIFSSSKNIYCQDLLVNCVENMYDIRLERLQMDVQYFGNNGMDCVFHSIFTNNRNIRLLKLKN